MFKKLFGGRGTEPTTAGAATQTSGGTATITGSHAAIVGSWTPPALPDLHVPSMVELEEQWRQDVARIGLDLREQFPAFGQGHGERLLVKLAVDLELTIRQPSQAAQEALSVAGSPDCELSALIRIVERDPALTRSLLRTSSSAFYGGTSAPASIDDAVRRLGAKGVQVAVLAGMAEALLARPTGCFSPLSSQVWAHMVRVGPIARSLARTFDVAPHEAFVLGLLHDVGKLVLCDVAGALREELRRDVLVGDDLASAALVALHEPLGGLALLRWGVEPRAALAIATHHRSGEAVAHDRLAEVLYLAERVDIAQTRGRELELARWQEEGRLTVNPAHVAAAIVN